MIQQLFKLVIVASLVIGTAYSTVEEKEIEVILGIDRIEKLDFVPSTQVQIGNDSILTHQLIPQKQELTFKGVKAGKTSVTVRNTVGDIRARYLVTIVENDQSRIVQELNEFLGDIEGLEIGIRGDTVFVGGSIVVPDDIGKVVVILDKYPSVVTLVELAPQTQAVIARKMQEEIQNLVDRNITVRVVNKAFWIEGVVDSEAKRTKANDIAVAYLPDNIESLARRVGAVQTIDSNIIVNFVSVNEQASPPSIPKMVKITAQFVELSKDFTRIFGFKWNPVLGGDGGAVAFGRTTEGGVTTKSSGTLAGTISNLFPKLASARNAGHARVVQSGVVVTQDGNEASLNKTSQTNFALGTGEFTRSEASTAGFQLSVTPTILPNEQVDLNISLSVSSNIGSPPERVDNTVRTKLVVKSAESAVVGGMVIDSSATDFDRNPPGGNDEIEDGQELFSFLRSKSYVTTKNQFVMFVTPELIESASDGTEEIKRKFRRRGR
jgi:pilus assembly protein CpaC